MENKKTKLAKVVLFWLGVYFLAGFVKAYFIVPEPVWLVAVAACMLIMAMHSGSAIMEFFKVSAKEGALNG